MNIAKHVAVDGTLGLVLGGAIDLMFKRLHDSTSFSENGMTALAQMVAKCLGQMYVIVYTGNEVSQFLYPSYEASPDDPTGGMIFLLSMVFASPHLLADFMTVRDVYSYYLSEKLFPIKK